MSWLVDLVAPDEGMPDRRTTAAVGVGLFGALLVGVLVLTRPKAMTEAEARAAYLRSLSGPPEARARAKATWDALRVASELEDPDV